MEWKSELESFFVNYDKNLSLYQDYLSNFLNENLDNYLSQHHNEREEVKSVINKLIIKLGQEKNKVSDKYALDYLNMEIDFLRYYSKETMNEVTSLIPDDVKNQYSSLYKNINISTLPITNYLPYIFLLLIGFEVPSFNSLSKINKFLIESQIKTIIAPQKLKDTLIELLGNAHANLKKETTFQGCNIFDNSIVNLFIYKVENRDLFYTFDDDSCFVLSKQFVRKMLDFIKNCKFDSIFECMGVFGKELEESNHGFAFNSTIDYELHELHRLSLIERESIYKEDFEYQLELEEQQRQEEWRKERAQQEQRIYEEGERRWEADFNERVKERKQQEFEKREEELQREQIEAIKNQTRASLDAQISALRTELMHLHGPYDNKRRMQVERQISDLENEKRRI